MRLVTFEIEGEEHIGAETPDGIVDFAAAASALPRTMIDFLAAGSLAMRAARAAVARSRERGHGLVPFERVKLLAPVPRPGKILGVALNYRDHAAETGQVVPEVPVVFAKAPSAVVGPGAPIRLPGMSSAIDYEGELAFVVGRRARAVSAADALEYIAGFTILVDVTARDVQARSGHCLAKSLDTFAPMGPAIVTTGEVPDPGRLRLRTLVSGELCQDSTTANLIFGVPALLEYLSSGMTLEPGDVVTTGTPAGVGVTRTPPRFLRRGDVVRVEIERIGVLENPVT